MLIVGSSSIKFPNGINVRNKLT